MTSGCQTIDVEALHRGALTPPSATDLLRNWDRYLEQGLYHWARDPKSIWDGDSHMGNTFIQADGCTGSFDRQVVYPGYGLRDSAYFLVSALSHDERVFR